MEPEAFEEEAEVGGTVNWMTPCEIHIDTHNRVRETKCQRQSYVLPLPKRIQEYNKLTSVLSQRCFFAHSSAISIEMELRGREAGRNKKAARL